MRVSFTSRLLVAAALLPLTVTHAQWTSVVGEMPVDSAARRILVRVSGRCPDLALSPVFEARAASGYEVHLDGERTRSLPAAAVAVVVGGDTTLAQGGRDANLYRVHGNVPVDYVLLVSGDYRAQGIDDLAVRVVDSDTGRLYVHLAGPPTGLVRYEEFGPLLAEALRR